MVFGFVSSEKVVGGKTRVQRFWFMEIPIYSSKVFFWHAKSPEKFGSRNQKILTKNIRNTPWKSNMNTKNKALERGNDLFKYDNLWYPCCFFRD